MANPRKVQRLPVTNPGPKPGDFPLGSPQSRAAARLLGEHKESQVKRLTFLFTGYLARWVDVHTVGGCKGPWATPWTLSSDGKTLIRSLVVPDGMTVEEAKRIVDGRNI